MALIKCPNCGKNVSDTIDICIHCNKPIIEENNASNITKKIEKPYIETEEMKEWGDPSKSVFSKIFLIIFCVFMLIFIILSIVK